MDTYTIKEIEKVLKENTKTKQYCIKYKGDIVSIKTSTTAARSSWPSRGHAKTALTRLCSKAVRQLYYKINVSTLDFKKFSTFLLDTGIVSIEEIK